MMKVFMLALVMMSFQAQAQAHEVIEVSCEGPALSYLNRFELNFKLEIDTNGEETTIEDQDLEARFTKRGHQTGTQNLRLENLKGLAQKNMGDMTVNPFYQIQLVNKEQGIRVFINADYPSKLNSSIQLSDGTSYKSTCLAL